MSLTNGKRGRVPVLCMRCRNLKFHEARGLCKCCYNHLAEKRCGPDESLADYPPLGGYGVAATVAHGHHSDSDAERMRRRLDPNHIPMKEATQ